MKNSDDYNSLSSKPSRKRLDHDGCKRKANLRLMDFAQVGSSLFVG